jgi:6-phosphogluconolactonase (cycloisomerase 2 family)
MSRMVMRNGMRLRELASSMGWRRRVGRVLMVSGLAGVLALSGCGKFFPKLTTGGGTGSGGDYLYAGNLGTSEPTVAGFSIASSALTVASNSPYTVSLTPTSLAVTPDDNYLFVGGPGGIYTYAIGSGGDLTEAGNDTFAQVPDPTVLRVDPTGNYLLGGDALSGTVYVFQIGSDGALSQVGSTLTLNANEPVTDMEFASNGSNTYLYASLGTAGIYAMSFSGGTLSELNDGNYAPKKSDAADEGMAVAPDGDTLFAAETVTGGVRVFTINSNGSLTESTSSPVTTGTAPWAVLVDATGSYVYVADRTKAQISAFSLASGKLTAIGSPIATGDLPVQMVEDNSKTYVAVVCTGGNPDVELYTIGTTGALTKFTTATTGTDPTEASSLAATH